MTPLIESFKRLYPNVLTIEKLTAMKNDGKITETEYNYIVGETTEQ